MKIVLVFIDFGCFNLNSKDELTIAWNPKVKISICILPLFSRYWVVLPVCYMPYNSLIHQRSSIYVNVKID